MPITGSLWEMFVLALEERGKIMFKEKWGYSRRTVGNLTGLQWAASTPPLPVSPPVLPAAIWPVQMTRLTIVNQREREL